MFRVLGMYNFEKRIKKLEFLISVSELNRFGKRSEEKIVLQVKYFIITGKSFSKALILASVNPQYDKRLFIEFPEKYKFTTCCVQKLFFCLFFDILNNICTQHVVILYFAGNSMNNLSSYCGFTDSRMKGSEKDLLSNYVFSSVKLLIE
jgi:hypothetical protein